MEIVEELGLIHSGGFGVIHKVRTDNGSIVARKTFKPAMADRLDDETYGKLKRRFTREVKIQEKLPADLFIPILHSSLSEDNPWFLMPLAEKVYIQEIHEAKLAKRVPNGLADILNSLEHLHDLGLVHRDLKPGNVLFLDGNWKLADLGLITSDSDITTSFVTSGDFGAGSNAYMAPEQVTDFHGVTHRADIYSFGAILHDIFNGLPRIHHAKLTADGKIGMIIEKCTETNINRRFKSVSALRSILLGYLSKRKVDDNQDEDVDEWVAKFKKLDEWNADSLDAFIIFTEKDDDAREYLFYEISTKFIKAMFEIDAHKWKRLVLMYVEWILNSSFAFDYCDVIVGHLFKAYELTEDLEVKSKSALAAARLGASHNRFYVMKYVLRMCSPSISDVLADRIAIEIYVEGDNVKRNFKTCTRQLNISIDRYHEKIEEVLRQP